MKTSRALVPLLVALSLVYWPSLWVTIFVFVDYYTPWVLFDSKLYDMYHNFLVSSLTEKPEIPLPELDASEATFDRVYKMSNGFTFPVVIRQLLGNTTGVQQWSNHDWWIKNYGDEELLCGTLSQVVEDCTVKGFFESLEKGNPFYISGASVIFERHPELHDMIDNEALRATEPGTRTATQIFMGLPDMGSDIHAAIGINVFRMIAGQKKWWFIPPDQTCYLKPSINVNGFSAHTQTLVGKQGAKPSPWLSKLTRYTSTLNPGDVLINPPWYWHGILNLGKKDAGDLVIGSPVRYKGGSGSRAAFSSNLLYTLNSFFVLWYNYGNAALRPDFKVNLQHDIANNRRVRENKKVVEAHPFEMAD